MLQYSTGTDWNYNGNTNITGISTTGIGSVPYVNAWGDSDDALLNSKINEIVERKMKDVKSKCDRKFQ